MDPQDKTSNFYFRDEAIEAKKLINKRIRNHETGGSSKKNKAQQSQNSTTNQNQSGDATESKSESPHFHITLKKYCSNYVHLPAQTKVILNEVPDSVKLQIYDGRQWEVKVNIGRRGQLSLGHGWAAFRRENNLIIRDTCVFKLIEKNVFMVTVT